jgi:hypothetical protein
MDVNTAKRLTEALVQEVTIEINSIKSHVVADIIMQMAIYSHDHIGAHTMTFGVLSESPSLDRKCLEELDQVRAVLLDREQRRNALRHLMHLIEEGNEEAVHLLQEELLRFFSEDETYEFLLEPESEYPNEYVKPYLDSE